MSTIPGAVQGTGKTELAVAICEILGVGREIVTATSDWTTFDTIGGYLPDPAAALAGGFEPLNFTPGCVTRSLERERWIVIDELNRADIDKAFGELFTMLSGQNVRLPFKRRRADGGVGDVVLGDSEFDTDVPIGVPEGWRIIGTMNTFDKASLYQMSFAFMRRFAFVDVDAPDRDDYEGLLTRIFHAYKARMYCAVAELVGVSKVTPIFLLPGGSHRYDRA